MSNYNIISSLIFTLIFTSFLSAQTDIILKKDGNEMKGKVLKINSDEVDFIYENETVEYKVPKSDIVKITFASGRIEFFEKPENKDVDLEDHHNKVAVLPFGYIKDQETSNEIMQKKIQMETYSIFRNKAANLKFQDPQTTNALLSKAGVNTNLSGFTMGELANILGVEYLIQGLVSVEKTSTTSFSNTNSSSKTKKSNKAYADRKGHIVGDIWNSGKRSSNSMTSRSTSQNYATNITMNVYTDKGDNLFSKDHQSFWNTQDAYKITLAYLAKRTPIFKR